MTPRGGIEEVIHTEIPVKKEQYSLRFQSKIRVYALLLQARNQSLTKTHIR